MVHAQGSQFGDYRLVSLLGEGGFAEVYEAEHVYLPGVKTDKTTQWYGKGAYHEKPKCKRHNK